MSRKKRRISRNIRKLTVLFTISTVFFILSFTGNVTAGSLKGSPYPAPTYSMDVDENVITGSAHCDAALALDMLGVNLVSGYGVCSGGAFTNLTQAECSPTLAVWGSYLNSNPNPYYWNLFYSYTTGTMNSDIYDRMLINYDRSGNPCKADDYLRDEYGGISVSISTRPDILLGCSGSGNVTDLSGYDSQIEAIRSFSKNSPYYKEGDEYYCPYLVSYNSTTIYTLIDTLYNLADYINESGKTTRYGDPVQIVQEYQEYIHGTVGYVKKELKERGIKERVIAIVASVEDNGVCTLVNNATACTAEQIRMCEYTDAVTINLADSYGTVVTIDQLKEADYAIGLESSGLSYRDFKEKLQKIGYQGGYMLGTAEMMYGVEGGCVENALGLAYFVSNIYDDVLDLSPVDLYAYYYNNFMHIEDISSLNYIVKTNFSSMVENPDYWEFQITWDDLNTVREQIVEGMKYLKITEALSGDKELNQLGIIYAGIDASDDVIQQTKAQKMKSFIKSVKDQLWADPVDTCTGAHTIDLSYLAQTGAIRFSYDMSYDSDHLVTSSMGTGWYSSYDKYIEPQEDGSFYYYFSPSSYIVFKPGEHPGICTTDAIGRKNWTLVTEDNEIPGGDEDEETAAYTITCGSGGTETYDAEGRLIGIADHTGHQLNITRLLRSSNISSSDANSDDSYDSSTDDSSDDSSEALFGAFSNGSFSDRISRMIITEPVSGKNLTVSYNKRGRVTKVTDTAGNTIEFGYTDGCLTSVKDPKGGVIGYTYDQYGHVLTGTDANGDVYFTNTYDEKGRVITQDDGSEGRTLFSYEDEGDGSRTTTITDRNGNTAVNQFDSDGLLICATDQNENMTEYIYDEDGNILTVILPSGLMTDKSYDASGNLLTEQDPAGHVTRYTYDERHNLLSVTYPDGGVITNTYDSANRLITTVDLYGKTTSCTYNTDGQLQKKTVGDRSYSYTYSDGLLSSVTQPDGSHISYTCDTAGRILTVTDGEGNTTAYTYDANGNLLTETDASGACISYAYDGRDQLVKKTGLKGGITRYTYDANGNLLTCTDAEGNVTSYTYDEEDRLLKIADSEGTLCTYTYDAAGRVLTQADGEGNTTSYAYDTDGNLLTLTDPNGGVTQYTYNRDGTLQTLKNAEGDITKYTYDAAGRQISVTNPLNAVTAYEYDIAGNLLSITDPLGETSRYTYNEYGENIAYTDANGNTQLYEYDDCGRQTSSEDALGNTTACDYDNAGNLVSRTDPNGFTSFYDYDPCSRLIYIEDKTGNCAEQSYDVNGNIQTVVNPEGGTTQYAYDDLNRMTSRSTVSGGTVSYTYNARDLMTQYENAREQECSIEYDRAGRIIKVEKPDDTITYTYDANGNVLTVTNQWITVYRSYDALNRVISYTGVLGESIGYSYDEAGNLTQLRYPGGISVSYGYDAANQLTSVTDWLGNVTQYTYDPVGNQIETRLPNGNVISYEYDAANRLTHTSECNSEGQVVNEYSYSHDPDGQVIEETFFDGVSGKKTVYTYDENGRLTAEQTENSMSGDILSETEYDSDANGNVSSVNQESWTGLSEDHTLTFDRQNRLLSYDEIDCIYDADGNMITGTLDGSTQANFFYASDNTLNSVDTESKYGMCSTYYYYDGDGTRAEICINQTTTEGPAQSDTICITDTNAALSRTLATVDYIDKSCNFYIYGNGLLYSLHYEDACGSYYDQSPEAYFYSFDYRGSTTALTDENGTVRARFGYSPYGELISKAYYDESGEVILYNRAWGFESYEKGDTQDPEEEWAQAEEQLQTPFLYNGRYGVQTDENGLLYMRSRYYSPVLMRFLNADRLQPNIAYPETLNSYAYANGNPISYIDPFGTSAELTEKVHTLFDALGMVPGVGMVFDAVNGVWYLVDGDYTSAAFCAAAFLPIVGDTATAAKLGTKGIKAVDKAVDATKAIDEAADVAKAAKNGTDIIRLSKNNIQHIKKHTFDGMAEQAKYLTDEQLVNKLNNMSFFNKDWSQEQIIENTQEAYNILRSQGKTGSQRAKIDGEIINIFIKDDGTFDTAYGTYKYTIEDFR